jgi:hypothetical protein
LRRNRSPSETRKLRATLDSDFGMVRAGYYAAEPGQTLTSAARSVEMRGSPRAGHLVPLDSDGRGIFD